MPLFFFRKSSRKIQSEISQQELVRDQQSIQQAQMAASVSFTNDPMRMGRVPDVIGSFVDPMGGARASISISRDPTCTGA